MKEAVEALRRGEVIAIPTDTVYGVAVDPFVAGATERLFAVKRRPRGVELPVLCADVDMALSLVGDVPEVARPLIERHWPGALTIVLPRRPGLDVDLGSDPTTIGVRVPDNPVLVALSTELGGPLAVSSANRHGEPPCTTPDEVRAAFGDDLPVVVDGGVCNGVPSTVVSCVSGAVVVLREGSLRAADL